MMHIIDFAQLKDPELAAPAPPVSLRATRSNRSGTPIRTHKALSCRPLASTVGLWRVNYTERELCHLLTGVVQLTDTAGRQQIYRAGDTFMIDKGFSGTWEVLEACFKTVRDLRIDGP